jgi:hypothetical protein
MALNFLHPMANKGNRAIGTANKGVKPEVIYIYVVITISKLKSTANMVSSII